MTEIELEYTCDGRWIFLCVKLERDLVLLDAMDELLNGRQLGTDAINALDVESRLVDFGDASLDDKGYELTGMLGCVVRETDAEEQVATLSDERIDVCEVSVSTR